MVRSQRLSGTDGTEPRPTRSLSLLLSAEVNVGRDGGDGGGGGVVGDGPTHRLRRFIRSESHAQYAEE